MIQATCSACSHQFTADDALAGATMNCAECGRTVRLGESLASATPGLAGAESSSLPPPLPSPDATSDAVEGGLLAGAWNSSTVFPPRDTEAGWRLAAVLLILWAVARLALLVYLLGVTQSGAANPPYGYADQAQPAASKLPGASTCFTMLGVVLATIAAVGLLAGGQWAKWLVLIFIAITTAALVIVAFYLKPSDLPFGSRIALCGLAGWGLIAWIILLDRPSNALKAATGFALVLGWEAALVWFSLGTA